VRLARLAAAADRGPFRRAHGSGCPGPPPHTGDDHDLGRLPDRGQPAPRTRLRDVPGLGQQQFGKPFALDDGAGGQPGEDGGRHEVQREDPAAAERDAHQLEQHDPRHEHPEEHTDLYERQRHRKPQVIELVQPLLDAPDVRVRG
jgi:hypothetical protein